MNGRGRGRGKGGTTVDIFFPIRGLHRGFVTERQPPETSFAMSNVRPYDSLSNRLRGGQRPALVKWGAGTLIGDDEQPIVAICTVSSII